MQATMPAPATKRLARFSLAPTFVTAPPAVKPTAKYVAQYSTGMKKIVNIVLAI